MRSAIRSSFLCLRDPGNVVADQFGAARTPEVFMLDRQRVVRYRGRIDDQYGFTDGVGYQRPAPREMTWPRPSTSYWPARKSACRQPGSWDVTSARLQPANENSKVTYSNTNRASFSTIASNAIGPGGSARLK